MKKTAHIVTSLISFVTKSIFNLFIFLIVGGLSGLLTFEIVNQFTDSSYGVNNIVLLITAFTFFPLLNAFFVIFYIQENRKKNKNKKNKNKAHLEV